MLLISKYFKISISDISLAIITVTLPLFIAIFFYPNRTYPTKSFARYSNYSNISQASERPIREDLDADQGRVEGRKIKGNGSIIAVTTGAGNRSNRSNQWTVEAV